MHAYVCAPLRDSAAFSKQSLCFAVDGCSLQVELVKADDSKGWTRVFEDSLVGAVAASAARDYTELADRMSGVPSEEGQAEQATLHAHDNVQQGGGKKAPLLQQRRQSLHSHDFVCAIVWAVLAVVQGSSAPLNFNPLQAVPLLLPRTSSTFGTQSTMLKRVRVRRECDPAWKN